MEDNHFRTLFQRESQLALDVEMGEADGGRFGDAFELDSFLARDIISLNWSKERITCRLTPVC